MAWSKISITKADGERVEAQAPVIVSASRATDTVIVSASRATDIPAFYPARTPDNVKPANALQARI